MPVVERVLQVVRALLVVRVLQLDRPSGVDSVILIFRQTIQVVSVTGSLILAPPLTIILPRNPLPDNQLSFIMKF